MLSQTHHRRFFATLATATALAATAPAASAMPIDGGGSHSTLPVAAPEHVRVVRVQVDQGLDWGDAGIGAAGMLALVLIGFGGAHALTTVPGREHSAARS